MNKILSGQTECARGDVYSDKLKRRIYAGTAGIEFMMEEKWDTSRTCAQIQNAEWRRQYCLSTVPGLQSLDKV